MPPRTRACKGTKTLKENIVAVDKTSTKAVVKNNKPSRKALADKTNSASDDNTSLETKKKSNKQNHKVITEFENIPRSRRDRRVPPRYIDNNVLNNLSNSKFQSENAVFQPKTHHVPVKAISPVKINTTVESPLKTSRNSLDNSLIANRPKRICRLPSKFDDHSISPSKYIPVKPCHASTPILENRSSKVTKKIVKSKNKQIELTFNKISSDKRIPQKRYIQNSPEAGSDSNNNAKSRLVRLKTANQDKTSLKEEQVKTTKKLSKNINNKSFSYRVLEDKKKSASEDKNLDIYEFTYDPNEEPPPAKKKRKKAVKKKPAKPKTVVFKNNYDQNVSKALAALKNAVTKKPKVPKVVISSAVENANEIIANTETYGAKLNFEQKLQENNTQVSAKESAENITEVVSKPASVTNTIEGQNYNSVRIEDIAADFEMSVEEYNDINYSPVNSPQHPKSPVESHHQTLERSVHDNDPLNLRGELSFFDDNPVASSSMNMSARHPQASPWRVEFGNLPIRWHVNSYVKPNMTPAVESSYISFEENKKKHVYTNMIGHDDCAPDVEQNQSNLKQTSIISFIREVVQRSAQKKKRGRSVTPTKANNLFDDLSKTNNANEKTPKKSEKSVDKNSKVDENVSNSSDLSKEDKENSNEITENKKKKCKIVEKNKDATFFGFDESEDLENVSPVKVNPKARALRPRARAVLKEINAMTGPMRALPLAAKSKITASSDAVNKVYEELKSAADAPVFPEKSPMHTSEVTTVDEVLCDDDDDSQSVHLFEDIELVHHLKPTRKSYGKAKKVTFRQHSTSSETAHMDREENVSSEEDDLADLTFTMPSFQPQKKAKKKRKTNKQKMSKKEQKALEEWAAGFNSMCQDIEDVPLIVE